MHSVKLWVYSCISGLYTTFVAKCLWNWFIAPVFHISDIGFLPMYGLIMIFSFLLDRKLGYYAVLNEAIWDRAFTILMTCVPESKEEEVKGLIRSREKFEWLEVKSKISRTFSRNTTTLLLGWAVYTLISF